MKKNVVENFDVVIVGAGIMGATLSTLLSEIDKSLNIKIIEKLDQCGLESSDGLNNAGTGHAGNCELNYTPEINGEINISKAISIAEKFEISLQFWSYIVKKYKSIKPEAFISKSPHASFVWQKKDIQFLKRRYILMSKEPIFKKIKYSASFEQIKKYFPLLIYGRSKKKEIAMTIYDDGTDVNFGELTRALIKNQVKQKKLTLSLKESVASIRREKDLYIIKSNKGESKAKFLFIAAGGQSLSLLQKLKIESAKGYAGFPISGKWLLCDNPEIIKKHKGKVYSQAEAGAPPMSVPHLDIRKIKNKEYLLFGPFAGFTFKFLKNGSIFDFPKSIKLSNLKELITVCLANPKLLLYLVKQILSGNTSRLKHLKNFYPHANKNDWALFDAGQRVQIIKPKNIFSGKLEFGTEIIYDQNKNMAALLGASPGASVSAASMLEIVEKCFLKENQKYQKKLREIFPSYGIKLNDNPDKLEKVRNSYRKILKLL
jgi:malate dehydrogenase (quinone)